MRTNGVVWVDVFELNHPIRRHQEHRRHGKLVMLLSRSRFQVDPVLCKKLQSGVIHLIGYPESSGTSHLAVGKESEADFVFFDCFADFGGLVRRDADDLESQVAELRFDVAQLNQLPVAVRSPNSSIKNQKRWLCFDGYRQIESRSIGGFHANLRDLDPVQRRTNAIR